MEVSQERRVVLAPFFFRKSALYWWELVKRRYQDPSVITWQIFQTAFDEQFYPLTYQNMRIEEFLQLKQGSMIVIEYEKKFIKLSKYCALLVADEKKKCQLFTRGLRPAIRDIVVSQRIVDYGVLVVSATLVESSQKAVRGLGDSCQRQFDSSGPSQGSSKRGNFSSGSSGSGGHGVFRARTSSNSGSIQSFSSRPRFGNNIMRGSGRHQRTVNTGRCNPVCGLSNQYHEGPCQ
ncbi:hypothetical protein L3X38_042087 [Prunus dulcis]|uniref:Retrotransposon gag domain-containing protein n=1 Tax=Prunus dulcis TaxID=3755 RepID=A0AAD4UV87_PRUDU|nr:hypothetical protein L3X38_042087 [Prunus dulcis]